MSSPKIIESDAFEDSHLNQLPSKKYSLDSKLQKQLRDLAVRRIGCDLVKSLVAIQRREFIDARNKVDVPHGLFGLNLDTFYARLKENTVYIDVLQLVCRVTLEQAKVCVVMDDLQDLIRRLFLGHRNTNMEPILREIMNSKMLLTVSDKIATDFKKNSEVLKKLQDKLSAFNVRERNAIIYVNSQVYAVQNNCVEAELVVDPIEFRYKMSFHRRSIEQSEEKSHQVEESLQNTLDDSETSRNREYIVSDCIQIKQRTFIDVLKTRIQEMTEQYDQEYERLDGQISYKTNAMEAMREQYRDCVAKLEFYQSDIGRLKEWKEMWEQKKLEDAKAELAELKPKKRKAAKKGKKKNTF